MVWFEEIPPCVCGNPKEIYLRADWVSEPLKNLKQRAIIEY